MIQNQIDNIKVHNLVSFYIVVCLCQLISFQVKLGFFYHKSSHLDKWTDAESTFFSDQVQWGSVWMSHYLSESDLYLFFFQVHKNILQNSTANNYI